MSSEQYYRSQPSQRQLRVGSMIQKAVSEAILMDEILYSKFHMISFVGVRMNAGLKSATIIFITSSESMPHIKTILKELSSVVGYFRKVIASNINLRYVPEVSFEYDKSGVELEKLNESLQKINANRE